MISLHSCLPWSGREKENKKLLQVVLPSRLFPVQTAHPRIHSTVATHWPKYVGVFARFLWLLSLWASGNSPIIRLQKCRHERAREFRHQLLITESVDPLPKLRSNEVFEHQVLKSRLGRPFLSRKLSWVIIIMKEVIILVIAALRLPITVFLLLSLKVKGGILSNASKVSELRAFPCCAVSLSCITRG